MHIRSTSSCASSSLCHPPVLPALSPGVGLGPLSGTTPSSWSTRRARLFSGISQGLTHWTLREMCAWCWLASPLWIQSASCIPAGRAARWSGCCSRPETKSSMQWTAEAEAVL